MGSFGYSARILEVFSGIRGGVIHLKGATNGPSPGTLKDAYTGAQTEVLAGLGDTPLSDLPSIAAWRRAFTSFGVKPTQYRNAVEALLRRLTKQGDIPSINTLVDTANMVSITSRLPVAVFDQRHVTGSTTVRHADGTERFTDLGGTEPIAPLVGEVVFVDDAGLVSARRWCWRQSDQSAARDDTTEAIITVEGQHGGANSDVEQAVTHLLRLIEQFQPGASTAAAILGPHEPRFDFE